MIAAQMAIARAIIGRQSTGPAGERSWSDGVRTYLMRQQNPDGGRGLHPLSPSTLFVMTLFYVALRYGLSLFGGSRLLPGPLGEGRTG